MVVEPRLRPSPPAPHEPFSSRSKRLPKGGLYWQARSAASFLAAVRVLVNFSRTIRPIFPSCWCGSCRPLLRVLAGPSSCLPVRQHFGADLGFQHLRPVPSPGGLVRHTLEGTTCQFCANNGSETFHSITSQREPAAMGAPYDRVGLPVRCAVVLSIPGHDQRWRFLSTSSARSACTVITNSLLITSSTVRSVSITNVTRCRGIIGIHPLTPNWRATT